MSPPRCPGQDMRYWKPQDVFDVRCPECGTELEFFKDEPFRHCSGCRTKVQNPRIDMGCAEWCSFSEACFGDTPGETDSGDPLCERLIGRMQEVFGDDQRRVEHAHKVLAYALAILDQQPADPLTVKAAAILHDIGIPEAERQHGSSAGRYQEMTGPPIARSILAAEGVAEGAIDHICRIIGSHHSAKDIDTPEFRVVWDADWLTNIPDQYPDAGPEKLEQLVTDVFKTERGRVLARRQFLESPETPK